MAECNKHVNCGETINAECVLLEDIEFPKWSSQHGEKCPDLNKIIKDIYDELSDIKDSLDLSKLGGQCEDCMDYGSEELTVGRVLYTMENKICNS